MKLETVLDALIKVWRDREVIVGHRGTTWGIAVDGDDHAKYWQRRQRQAVRFHSYILPRIRQIDSLRGTLILGEIENV